MSAPTPNPPSELDVVHDDEGHRYVLRNDGEHVGLIDYRVTDTASGEALDLHHTEIRPDLRGNGLGAVLVRGTLEDLSERDGKIIPTCWFVREFIGTHPEFERMVTER